MWRNLRSSTISNYEVRKLIVYGDLNVKHHGSWSAGSASRGVHALQQLIRRLQRTWPGQTRPRKKRRRKLPSRVRRQRLALPHVTSAYLDKRIENWRVRWLISCWWRDEVIICPARRELHLRRRGVRVTIYLLEIICLDVARKVRQTRRRPSLCHPFIAGQLKWRMRAPSIERCHQCWPKSCDNLGRPTGSDRSSDFMSSCASALRKF